MLLDISSTLSYILLGFLVIWLVILVVSLVNISKRRDISLPVKAFWVMVIVVAPVIGLICYLIFGRKGGVGL